jgi:molybdenum storage protein
MTSFKDVPSALMRQTLLDRELVKPVGRPVRRLLPWLEVVVLGGRSVVDHGLSVLGPLVTELASALDSHRLLVLTGSGLRARHILGVGLDLGLPTGVLAGLAATEAEQNGRMVAALLAEHGVSYLPHSAVAHQLAVHLAASNAVVSTGYPPYGLYDFPPAVGKLPPHRTDSGALLLADAYGAARVLYVKDVDGISDGAGGLLTRVAAADLKGRTDLSIDPLALDLLADAKHVRELRIVNGHLPGNLTRALAGEQIGTLVHADRPPAGTIE